MSERLDPLDILHHVQVVRDLLETNSEFEAKYEEYVDSASDMGSERRKRYPMLALGQTHPIIPKLYNAQQAVDNYFRSDSLRITNAVLEISRIGRVFSELSEIEFVRPDFSPVEGSMKEVWGERLWKESDYSDAVFELEMAAWFLREGFDTYLIDEGEQVGPDIIIKEAGSEVWVECKRKREKTEQEREFEKARAKLADEVWDRVDLGDDSFAVDISMNSTMSMEHVDDLADEIAHLVERKKGKTTLELDGLEIRVTIEDYYEGGYTLEDRGSLEEATEIFSESGDPLDPFPHIDYKLPNGLGDTAHSETLAEISRDQRPKLYNSIIYGFHSDVDYEFYIDWIMNAIQSAREDLSGHSPAVGIIDVPADKLETLNEFTTVDHTGNKVTLSERLGQRIWGQLLDSSSLNGLIITYTTSQEKERYTDHSRPFSSYIKEDASPPLPIPIEELFRGDD